LTITSDFDIIMLLFSWKKVFYHAGGKPKEIVQILNMLTYKDIPFSKRDKKYKYMDIDFSGQNFLLHPEVLLYNAYKHTNRDIAIYISLASLRSTAAYLAHKVLTLDLLHAPEGFASYLDDPSILPIENDVIHFIYEEANNQTQH
jgi:hypothetical protein